MMSADKSWHSRDINSVVKELETDLTNGLSSSEALERLARYGANMIPVKKKSVFKMFLSQFTNFLILILIVGAVISMALGELLDSIAIIAIVILMGFMGFIQEYRSEKTLEALKKLVTPIARVLRDGEVNEVESTYIVPGDVILLREGDIVPADARLVEAEMLEIDESPLTGESVPVEKDPDEILQPDTPVSDRVNMVFMGTHVVKGRGKAVVVATGASTELGKIAAQLTSSEEEKTPLEEELDYFGKRIGVALLLISLIVFAVMVFKEEASLLDAFMLAVSLAVAAIPEGLPAIATAVLAIGARKMAEKKALVRRLAAVETLGSVNVILSDKTGTITKGEMTVKKLMAAGVEYDVEGVGYEPRGEVKPLNGGSNKPIFLAKLLAAHISPDVSLTMENNTWVIKGSPTEGAALVLAYKVLGEKGVREAVGEFPIVKTIPFDRFRKRKTTIHRFNNKYIAVSSGAPDLLLEVSRSIAVGNDEELLTEERRKELLKYIESMASNGFRTYGVAIRVLDNIDLENAEPGDIERDMVFYSIMGIIDSPREGVREAVETARKAGIKVIMVTGDHKLTAMAVGRMIGLNASDDEVLEGKTLDSMSDEELLKVVDKIKIFARVTPEHKARIARLLKAKGYRIAMTGDGVNDAPALKIADIGVAMGIRGTEVAKEASQMILLDDSFVTIIDAIKEGRVIYENIKKTINYLLSCNMGEIAVVFGASLAGMPPPLEPIHLLWINVTTDAFPAIALGMEPPEPGILEKPPRSSKDRLITMRKMLYYVVMGSLLGGLALLLYSIFEPTSRILAETVVFTTIAISEFGRALVSRSENLNIWKLKPNKWLVPALLASLVLQLIIVYTPLNRFFNTVPLTLEAWMYIAIVPLVIFITDEVRKQLGIKLSPT